MGDRDGVTEPERWIDYLYVFYESWFEVASGDERGGFYVA